jgi:tetratricopeptide (TPR) repeat protein
MAQKRISRARKRDLEKPDEFLTLTSRLLEKIKTYWKPISAGGVVLLVILVGVLAARYFSERAEAQAFVLLNQAMNHFTTERRSQDPAKALDAVTPEFETLFTQYGDRRGGAEARLIFAQMNYLAGRPEAAVIQYEEALKLYPENSFAASAVRSGLGYAQAAAGQNEKAIATFTALVDGQNSVFKADALYQLSLLYRKTGQETAYAKTIQTLKEEFPQFMYAGMIADEAGS